MYQSSKQVIYIMIYIFSMQPFKLCPYYDLIKNALIPALPSVLSELSLLICAGDRIRADGATDDRSTRNARLRLRRDARHSWGYL